MSKIKEGDRVNVYGFFGEDARKATVTAVHPPVHLSVRWDEPIKTTYFISHTYIVKVEKCRKLRKKSAPSNLNKVVIDSFGMVFTDGDYPDLILLRPQYELIKHLAECDNVRVTFEVL